MCAPHLPYPVLHRGTLWLFRGSAAVSNAAVNAGLHLSLQITVFRFFGRCSEERLLGHMVTLFFIFWEFSTPLSIVAVPVYIPTSSESGLLFLYNRSNREENIGAKLKDLGHRDDFTNLTPKAREAKTKTSKSKVHILLYPVWIHPRALRHECEKTHR